MEWLTDKGRYALFPTRGASHHRKPSVRCDKDLIMRRSWVQTLLNEYLYTYIYKQHLYKQSPDTLMVNFALFQNYLLSSSTLSSKNIRAYSTIFANWRVCMFFHKIIWLIVMKIKMIIKIDNIDRILKDLELDKNTNIPIYYTQYIYCEMSGP